jgi:hypothetical protein
MDPGRACAFLDAPQATRRRRVSYRVEPDINRTWSGLACRFRLELESPITLQACRANSIATLLTPIEIDR